MTIPSRPAPPPPQTSAQRNQHQNHVTGLQQQSVNIKLPPPPKGSLVGKNSNAVNTRRTSSTTITRNFPPAKTRYAPVTDWHDTPFEPSSKLTVQNYKKKTPPPRPPPPKINNAALKRPGGPPQSVNMLSNIFGKNKNKPIRKLPAPKIPPLASQYPNNYSNGYNNTPGANHQQWIISGGAGGNGYGDSQLISFDSPPSSPTLTQKSNSDCVSVDSFSSDSNFSSPQNGSVSQAESGFEDDFTSPSDPWDTITNGIPPNGGSSLNDFKFNHPVRNFNAINKNQIDNPLCNGKSLFPPPVALSMPTIIRPKIQNSPSNSIFLYGVLNNKAPAPKPPISTPKVNNELEHSSNDSISSPPMPSCPPPPPPTILDVVAGNIDATELYDNDELEGPSFGIALYDFDGIELDDLPFKINEKIYLLKKLNDEWYLGRNKRGCEGMFPLNYVEVKVPLRDDSPIASSNYSSNSSLASNTTYSNSNNSTETISNLTSTPNKVRALYNFTAEIPEDLSLKANDIVTVLYKINEDWLYGELGNNRGQFPANFIEYIPENLPLKQP